VGRPQTLPAVLTALQTTTSTSRQTKGWPQTLRHELRRAREQTAQEWGQRREQTAQEWGQRREQVQQQLVRQQQHLRRHSCPSKPLQAQWSPRQTAVVPQ
jgi:hypothetical protein